MRYKRDLAKNFDSSILEDLWDNMKRDSDDWRLQQAGLFNQADAIDLLLEGKIDVDGAVALLIEMSKKNKDKVQSYCARKMEHLLKLKYTTLDDPKNHWIKEVGNYTLRLRAIFCKKGKIVNNRDLINNDAEDIIEEAYVEAVKDYKNDVKKNPYLKQGLVKFPKESPWSLEDLILKDANELLDVLD